MIDSKTCPCCKQLKTYSEFYTNKARVDGVSVYCIGCLAIKHKESYLSKYKKKVCVICGESFLGVNATRCTKCKSIREQKKVDGYTECLNCGFKFPFRHTLRVRGHGRIREGGVGSYKQRFCSQKCALTFRNKTAENIVKVSNANKGRPSPMKGTKLSLERTMMLSLSRRGELNPNWHGGTSKLQSLIRQSAKYRKWRNDVYQRDDFTCQWCGLKGGHLQADHIEQFAKILSDYHISSINEAEQCEKLWDINNGRTLCIDCHKTTDTYLKGKSHIYPETPE